MTKFTEAIAEEPIDPDERLDEIYCHDGNSKITYIFSPEQSDDSFFLLKLTLVSKNWPLYAIIEIEIYSNQNMEKPSHKFCFNISQMNEKDEQKVLKTKLLTSDLYCGSYKKMNIKCQHFPTEEIPVGLSSQNSLCYLNSVLQMLFNIPKFKQIIFSFPIQNFNQKKPGIILALQRLFSQMSNSKCAQPGFIPSALELAKSFGWTHEDFSEEQDANEFLTIFLQKIFTLFSDYPDRIKELNRLFIGKALYNSNIEDFDTFSLPLKKDLDHSLKIWAHPNCKNIFSKFYFTIKKLIDFYYKKEPMPSEYQIFTDALVSFINKNQQQRDINNIIDTSDSNDMNMAQVSQSLVKILKENAIKKDSNPYLKFALMLQNLISAYKFQDINKDIPSETAKNLVITLINFSKNKDIIENIDGNEVLQQICNFYLDDKVEKYVNETNYLVETPHLFIFKISRFQENNGTFKKNNDFFSFPEYFSLKEYLLPQSNNNDNDEYEYELLSIISHSGEIDSGHYIEFSRNPVYKDYWFKIDEKLVTLVSKNDVFDGNYGENRAMPRSASENVSNVQNTPNRTIRCSPTAHPNPKSLAKPRHHVIEITKKKPIIHKFNAYMLLYVNKKYIKDIIDIDVEVPDPLKNLIIPQKAKIVQPSEPKMNMIHIMIPNSISSQIEEDHFCMMKSNIIEKCPIKIDRNKSKLSTIKDIYNIVLQELKFQFQIEEDKEDNENSYPFVLWTCLYGFKPNKPLYSLNERIEDGIKYYYDTFILVQSKDKNYIDKPFSINDRLFYTLFFDPYHPNDCKYIGLILLNTSLNITTVYAEIMDKLKKAGIQADKQKVLNEDQPIEVFYESQPLVANHLRSNQCLSNAFNQNSSNLIVQFSYLVDLMNEEDHSLCNSFNYEDGKSYTKYMMMLTPDEKNAHPFNPIFIEYYYKMHFNSFDLTFHRISTGDHVTLKVPRATTMDELSRILYKIFIEFESARNTKNTVLVSMQPISKHNDFLSQFIEKEYENINTKIKDLIEEDEKEDKNEKKENINESEKNDQKLQKLVMVESNVMAQLFYTNQKLLYPSTMPIQIGVENEIKTFLPRFNKHLDIFFDLFPKSIFKSDKKNDKTKTQTTNKMVVPTTPFSKDFFTIRVEISDDSIIHSKIYQIIIDNNQTTFIDVAQMIGIDPNDLQTDKSTNSKLLYRIIMITNGKIVKTVTDYKTKILENDRKNYVFRFEKVPDESKGSLMIRVHYGISNDKLQAKLFGEPFYLTLNDGESESSLFQRIKQNYMKFMKPDESTQFVITNPQMQILKGYAIDKAFYAAIANNPNSYCICILMNNKVDLREIISMEKASSRGQLKIYT